MCIVVFMWRSHPLFPFICLFNRDEFHSRPTKPVGWWEGGEILGGRDEVGGGMWLACSKSGRLAFLTNFWESESLPNAKNRGDLPVRFLKSQKDPLDFAAEIKADVNSYKGFNLILTDICTRVMVHVTNRPKEDSNTIMEVSQGVHVLTNSSLDCSWPKAQRLSHAFKEVFGGSGAESAVDLRQMVEKMMTDTVKAEESEIPSILAKDFEIQTSSIFTDTDTELGRYGTRSMSAVAVKGNGEVSFYERYLDENSWKEDAETYKIDQHISHEL